MVFRILLIVAFYGFYHCIVAPAPGYGINATNLFRSYPYHGYIGFSTSNLTMLEDDTPERFTPGVDRDSESMQFIPADSLTTKKKIAWSNRLQSEERPKPVDMLGEETKIPLPDDFSQNRNLALLYKSSEDNLALPRPFQNYSQKRKIFLPLGLFWFLKQKF